MRDVEHAKLMARLARNEESADSEEKLDRDKLIAQVSAVLDHVENLIWKADKTK